MLIPLILAIFVFLAAVLFRFLAGPFYWGNNSDPSYFYIYNFIDVLEHNAPAFVDHPGTTLDLLGAALMKLFYPAPKGLWLLQHALQTEDLLNLVWFSMIILYVVSFLILGWYLFQRSKDRIFTGIALLGALWLVRIPSFSAQGIEPISANVNSDTMMMTAVNLMVLAITSLYFCQRKTKLRHAVILGLASAFAIATKFTAIPFCLVALILLPSWKQRILFLSVAGAGFLLWTWPIWGSYEHMGTWLQGLVMDRGMHGSGGTGFDLATFSRNMWWVIHQHWFFVILWLAAVIAGRRSRTILALGAGGLLQLVMVAKQPSYQYMAPMIGLSSLILAVFHLENPSLWAKGFRGFIAALAVVSLACIGVSAYQLKQTTQKTEEMLRLIGTEYAACKVCPFYRSSTPGFGLVFWNRIVHRYNYAQALKKHYPQMAYYDIFTGDFKASDEELYSLNMLRRNNARVLLYGSNLDPRSLEPYVTVRKIRSNGGSEALYEVISQRSKSGLGFLKDATRMAEQGKYEEALKMAAISYELGIEESKALALKIYQENSHP